MIIVTGATDALNAATIDHLLNRVPGAEVVAAVRDPVRAERFAAQGVSVRRVDHTDPVAEAVELAAELGAVGAVSELGR